MSCHLHFEWHDVQTQQTYLPTNFVAGFVPFAKVKWEKVFGKKDPGLVASFAMHPREAGP